MLNCVSKRGVHYAKLYEQMCLLRVALQQCTVCYANCYTVICKCHVSVLPGTSAHQTSPHCSLQGKSALLLLCHLRYHHCHHYHHHLSHLMTHLLLLYQVLLAVLLLLLLLLTVIDAVDLQMNDG
jgi:hypothetical protein